MNRKLIKDGFKGDVVCTSATRDLCAIMLLDSGFIQERNAEYANKKRVTLHSPVIYLLSCQKPD